jgi:hypothetical protein
MDIFGSLGGDGDDDGDKRSNDACGLAIGGGERFEFDSVDEKLLAFARRIDVGAPNVEECCDAFVL